MAINYLQQHDDLKIIYNAHRNALNSGYVLPENTELWLALLEDTMTELKQLHELEQTYLQKTRTIENVLELVYCSAPNVDEISARHCNLGK